MDRSAASGRWEAAKVDSVVLLFSKITDLHALPTLLQRLSPSEQVCGIATCNQPEYDLPARSAAEPVAMRLVRLRSFVGACTPQTL
jgi:hypothetical protein